MRLLIVIALTGLTTLISMFNEKADAKTISEMEITSIVSDSAATCDRR